MILHDSTRFGGSSERQRIPSHILQGSIRVYTSLHDSPLFYTILHDSARFCTILNDSIRFYTILQDPTRYLRYLRGETMRLGGQGPRPPSKKLPRRAETRKSHFGKLGNFDGCLPLGVFHWESSIGSLPLGFFHWESSIGGLPLGIFQWGLQL